MHIFIFMNIKINHVHSDLTSFFGCNDTWKELVCPRFKKKNPCRLKKYIIQNGGDFVGLLGFFFKIKMDYMNRQDMGGMPVKAG